MRNLSTAFFSLLLLVCILPLSSQAQRNWKQQTYRASSTMGTEQRTITEAYTAIIVTDGIKVNLSYGSNTTLDIEANDNLLERIKTKVVDDELILTLKRGRYTGNINIEIDLVVGERPTYIKVTDGSALYAKSIPAQKELKLKVTDSAKVEVAGGKIDNFNAIATDGARVDAFGLRSDNCEAKATDVAKLEVSVADNLIGLATDGAKIRYQGSPRTALRKTDSGRIVSVD